MNLLLDLSLRGSIAFALVFLLDWLFAARMSARGRRWWWAVVPLAFLVIIPLPALPSAGVFHEAVIRSVDFPPMAAQTWTVDGRFSFDAARAILGVWLGGAVIYLTAIMIQTRAATRRWSGQRLCTDSALLSLLEDCKQEASVTAPIGLMVSDQIPAPAILGWFRPRILLPEGLVSSMSRSELRAVLFHELAHFQSLDLAFNWLYTLVRAIHWFNPAAHLAFAAWSRFREEAADETAMTWMKESAAGYGDALLHALRQISGGTPAFGALAIGESIHNLKRRITMINHHQRKSPRLLLAGAVLAILALAFVARPVLADNADPKAAAVAAMQTWLTEIDHNQYAQSWMDSAPFFQKSITPDNWIAALNSVRTPLGDCTSRKLASALHQTEVPGPTGTIKGDFVVAQFNTSFQNLAYAVETVSFERTSDGTWKADGYYIKPKL